MGWLVCRVSLRSGDHACRDFLRTCSGSKHWHDRHHLMGEPEVEEDRHVVVDHDKMVKAHASSVFVVQTEVAGVAAAVVVVLAGRQVTDIVAAALG